MIETSAEQLKRIKRLVEYDIERAFYHDLDLEKGLSLLEILYEHLDIEWLIEQAERVQEMEEKNKELNGSLEIYTSSLSLKSTLLDDSEYENKRYREALAFYANKENYSKGYHDLLGEVESEIEMDEGSLARQVITKEVAE